MEVDTTTWVVGFAIAGVVVVIVVAVVLAITMYATRIRDQVGQIIEALTEAESNTDPLWNLMDTNHVCQDIVLAAEQARSRLSGERSR